MDSRTIGEFKRYNACRFCANYSLTAVINLGDVPLAGGFIKRKELFPNEKFYPLEISFCKKCFLVQSTNVIPGDVLFKNYFYKSSVIKTLVTHFKQTAAEIASNIKNKKDAFVVEIGANDGTFVNRMVDLGIKTIGVDPATNIVKPLIDKGAPFINDYFSENLAKHIVKKFQKADVIFSSNTLAHIEDMHDVLRGVKQLLKSDGILIFEVHYVGNLINELQYDMIYHEHQYYYSLLTLLKFLKKFDLEVYDVRSIPIHAGSMRYYVQNKKGGFHKISRNVENLIIYEKKMKLDKPQTYLNFDLKIRTIKEELIQKIKNLKKKGKTIAGYGASGRGTIIMNYCVLNSNLLEYVIDDSPAKQGTYTPGTHLPIVGSDILRGRNRPDFVLLFAWSFLEEIKKRNLEFLKNGGRFIIPLPHMKII